ncbi:transcriptional regulatory protein DEP1 [Paecilomyces variotii No. 5]|uniref:Transcriptional regulatory protein DEP1 n=1 Tax=Byssochlamys spectabilis (strain No. 5 / NBRC 109023) TaxID=1356009 RepID=V5HT63_BYSSN|nr:transcriptional regulatory protein DEP1 [Paecilomyces variotii No. 5]
MEVAESRETAPAGGSAGASAPVANGDDNLIPDDVLIDDGRSSSLSDIDYVSDQEPSDEEPSKPGKGPGEVDSEAETERIEDSPNNIRLRRDIVVSASGLGNSPSKLAQSTTYDDVDDDGHTAEDSPSKIRRSSRSNGLSGQTEQVSALESSHLSESAGKKRKRFESGDDTGTDQGEQEPLRKRKSSLKSDAAEVTLEGTPLSPEPTEETSKVNEMSNEGTPLAEEAPELEVPVAPTRGKKGKRGKRKGRKAKDADEDTEIGGAVEAGAEGLADDQVPDEEEGAEGVEEPEDAEAVAKAEEESAKKMSAMDSLVVLEKEFATLRDRIYDERIAKLNHELEQLTGPNPTHPEFLRQLEGVRRYRDAKIKYESTLFQYRLKSLLNKSLAERAQTHSTFFQRVRDVRERHSSVVSKQFYAIQHDRFKTEDVTAHHYIPFPTRRSQQIAQQTAYNQEVSVLSGVAKYVGFPAAPSLAAARPSEIEEDFEKMGISTETRSSQVHQSGFPRGLMSAMPSSIPRTAAEEAFLEQTPWANPQHPVHQQPSQQKQQSKASEQAHMPSYTTPAGQKRVVDIHAPNGSASTIADHNSSAANTPYGTEQEPRPQGHFSNPDYDSLDRNSGFRSLSSSPLDVRKPHPHANAPDSGPRNVGYSPPSARLGLFNTPSKGESSPPLASKNINAMHQSTGITASAGSSRMTAR